MKIGSGRGIGSTRSRMERGGRRCRRGQRRVKTRASSVSGPSDGRLKSGGRLRLTYRLPPPRRCQRSSGSILRPRAQVIQTRRQELSESCRSEFGRSLFLQLNKSDPKGRRWRTLRQPTGSPQRGHLRRRQQPLLRRPQAQRYCHRPRRLAHEHGDGRAQEALSQASR